MAELVVLAFVVVIVFLLVRILNLTDSARAPKIFAPKHPFVDKVLQSCPILFQRYVYELAFFKNKFAAMKTERLKVFLQAFSVKARFFSANHCGIFFCVL